MRFIIVVFLLLGSANAAHAETILARIKGMVCAFCATGIEKTFKKQPAVADVRVDLESKLITLNTKPDQTIDDATIKKLVGDAGYDITDIERK